MINNYFKLSKSTLKILEVFFYYLIIVYFSVQPFFANYFTFDGPAHLYNSNLLNQIIAGNDINLAVTVNSILVPNWSGHFLLAIFQFFIDPVWSEQLLLCLIILLTNISFRRLIIALEGNVWASWLFFPFVTSFIFFMGFYNLSIGVLLMFFFLEQFILTLKSNDVKHKQHFFLAILFIAIYFSHLFIFLYTGLTSILIILYYSKKELILKNLIKLLLISIAPLILVVLFLLSQPKGVYEFIPKMELLIDLFEGRIVNVFGDPETNISTAISLSIILTLILPFVLFFKTLFIKPVYFLTSSILLCLIMYFILPNANGYVGFISVRLLLLTFINIIILIAITYQRIPSLKPLLIISAIILSSFSILRTINFSKSYGQMEGNYLEVLKVAKEVIPKNSIIIITNKSNHWFYPHLDNYLGVYNKNVWLKNSNYEMWNNYFPLIEKENSSSNLKHFKVIEVEFNPKDIYNDALYESEFISIKEL